MVFYLYNLDYMRGAGSELALHVKMCILADKYNIEPLRLLANAHFKQAAANPRVWEEDQTLVCEAITCAYGAPQVTKEIRAHIVSPLVKNDALGFISKNPGSALDIAMREYADVGIDVAMALREHCPGGREESEDAPSPRLAICATCCLVFCLCDTHVCLE